ncbi:nucleotide exchange factor GrpE [Dactylosporangium sp. NPDC000555]|uniref:nucleotide exchange factor GrpE n=1 Tax=Dactylosporangium sp. NPDC000555 TaxID=3154260 RepID=UPI00332C5F63
MTDAQKPAAPEAPEAEAIDAVDETVVTAEAEADAEPEKEKPVEGEIVDEEFTVHAPDSAAEAEAPNQAAAQGTTDDAHQHGLGAELAALRTELDERTRDLQRVTAEYANYRKRVDRDRALVVEQASANVLGALLPVLDDLDRARDHGDLVGPFGSVAEQLIAALTKFGLTVFGAKGDPFDPTRHEAVAHLTSAEVSEPTCIDVMRRGYLLGERLLRPALVAVADPE